MIRSFRLEIDKEEINDFPLRKFEGNISLIEDFMGLEEAITYLNSQEVLGIDTESKPAFKKGEVNEVSLLQLSSPERAFLFRINKLGLTSPLLDIFSNRNIIKVGIALDDDIRQLQRLNRFSAENFLDLNSHCRELGFQSIGAKKLSALILGFRISKREQTSNWEAEVLTSRQLDYAATDAWICRLIYDKLRDHQLL